MTLGLNNLKNQQYLITIRREGMVSQVLITFRSLCSEYEKLIHLFIIQCQDFHFTTYYQFKIRGIFIKYIINYFLCNYFQYLYIENNISEQINSTFNENEIRLSYIILFHRFYPK